MSRVDDDRDAARVAERLLQQAKQAEAKTKDRAAGDSAFARTLTKGQGERTTSEKKKSADDHSSIAQSVLEEALLSGDEMKQQGGKLGSAFQHRMRGAQQETGKRTEQGRSQDLNRNEQAQSSRGESVATGSREFNAHTGEMKRKDEEVSNLSLGASARGKGDLETEGESSGKGGGGSDKDQNSGGFTGGSFRLNPALMAPVAPARPKDVQGNAKLRALAQEIAQKIVERARVGTNAAGQAEFQIDLRSNVLKGLSIKISGGNGKIKATFSGSDKEILRMLREQGEGLKQALAGRGLSLEEFKVEERA